VSSSSTPSLHAAEQYWNAAAETYVDVFAGTHVGQARRRVVWSQLEHFFLPSQRILEISCGTGIDAIFLSQRGVRVLACDLSPRMIQLARNSAAAQHLTTPPDFRVLPTEHLASLLPEAPFDGAFSNFSGLNCVQDLASVGKTLGHLLKPGAPLVLCMMGRFVPLEILWFLAHASARKAFRRLLASKPEEAEKTGLTIQRPSVRQIAQSMSPSFKLMDWRGIGIVVPPSYAEHVVARAPRLFPHLESLDRRIGPLKLFRTMADCVLLHFERISERP
jgi:SAM-dependent methyltransferase